MIFANAELVSSMGLIDVYKVDPGIFMPFASTSYYWFCRDIGLEFTGPFKSIAECVSNFEQSMLISDKIDLNNMIFIDFKKRRRIK